MNNFTHKQLVIDSKYCNDLTKYSRWQTQEVKIGDLMLGGNNPIRVQSMTTTNTMDTNATVEQAINLIEAGCELVRITAPSIKEAENLGIIKKELRKRGYATPLVADIHFTPNAAEVAARLVEKVRINPGNYVDKKKFEFIDYTEASYEAELERIRKKFIPLVQICKTYGTAMRIGTNHGSLSDRILSRYGDTPEGMVASAMEFINIARAENYHNLVLSMKASNTQVMVQAYRLLVKTMMEANMRYPLHLGVTEAGDGEDGRTKSAVGIGALLEDGLGDTIRVSLTEDPIYEIPVAKALVERYAKRINHAPIMPLNGRETISLNTYQKRFNDYVGNIGGEHVPVVIANFADGIKEVQEIASCGYTYHAETDKYNIDDQAADYVYFGFETNHPALLPSLGIIYEARAWEKLPIEAKKHPIFAWNDWLKATKKHPTLNFVRVSAEELCLMKLQKDDFEKVVLVIYTKNEHAMAAIRRAFWHLETNDIACPVIIERSYNNLDFETVTIHASTDVGALLLDGLGDGLWLKTNEHRKEDLNRLGFGILQATRTRISKTEYIACPSCGRTLFDLQETTAKIRKVTAHLKGVKIGIMGCIVNGPGEMADADFGYVGSGIDKITLYKGQEIVAKGIDAGEAVDALIQLIKDNGRWVEPKC